jgi:hypothetical protein
MEELFKELEERLKFHDWNYDYSDDHIVYKRGSDNEQQINRLYLHLMAFNEPKAIETWNKYAPANRQRELHLF